MSPHTHDSVLTDSVVDTPQRSIFVPDRARDVAPEAHLLKAESLHSRSDPEAR